MVALGHAIAHPFEMSCVRSTQEATAYWRDVGTVDAYWRANLDLTDPLPELDMYDAEWPIWTYQEQLPPAKFVHDVDGRRGHAVESLVSGGCIISGARVRRSRPLFQRAHPFVRLGGRVRPAAASRTIRAALRVAPRRGRQGLPHSGRHADRLRPEPKSPALPSHRAGRGPGDPVTCCWTWKRRPPRPGMKVLYVCTELFPLLKTGGLGDVGAALPPPCAMPGATCGCCCPASRPFRSGVNRSRLPPASPLALPDGDGPRLASWA